MGQWSAPGAQRSPASSIQALVQVRGITPERILRQPRCKLACRVLKPFWPTVRRSVSWSIDIFRRVLLLQFLTDSYKTWHKCLFCDVNMQDTFSTAA